MVNLILTFCHNEVFRFIPTLDEECKTKVSLLTQLKEAGLVEFIVQQRHDGLVQRAGFRERELLEFYPELGRPAQARHCSINIANNHHRNLAIIDVTLAGCRRRRRR